MLDELRQKFNALFSDLHSFTIIDEGEDFGNNELFVFLNEVSVISAGH